ncbi:hypothetical protein KFL_002750130 [Klebsormidium nitens]|uniref:Glycosyl transferase family 1 domain-containing protein n=1 Tax=Klebsormidium nitens TaxID=105231 RepID=A0A1Y1IBW3_KLENI|nr:hypothetical protein KFL_002750130 [Klebsormidium nitens]|eukprot:GAQ86196.1 hypothetical protein KFL_002750130 [Klebsormidium nitens]
MGLPWRSKKQEDDSDGSDSGEWAEPKMKYTDDPCRARSSTRSRGDGGAKSRTTASPSRSRGMSSNALKGMQNGQLESTATSRPMKRVASDPGLRRLGSRRLLNGRRSPNAARAARVAWVGCAWLLWITCMALSGYFLLSMLLEGHIASRTSSSLPTLPSVGGHSILNQAPNATATSLGLGGKVRELWGGWFNSSEPAPPSLEKHHQLPDWDPSTDDIESVRKEVDLGRKGRFGGAGGLLRKGFLWLGLGMKHSSHEHASPRVDLPTDIPEVVLIEETPAEVDRLEKKLEVKGQEGEKEEAWTSFVIPYGLEDLGTGASGLWAPPAGGAFSGAVAGKRVLLVTRDWPEGCCFGRTMINIAGAALSSNAQVTALLLPHLNHASSSVTHARHLTSQPDSPSETLDASTPFSEKLRSLGVSSIGWASEESYTLAANSDVILAVSAYAGPWLDGLLAAQSQAGGRVAWWIMEGKQAEFDTAKGGLARMLGGESGERGTAMFVNAFQAEKWHGWLRTEVSHLQEAEQLETSAQKHTGVNGDVLPGREGSGAEEKGVNTQTARREGERRALVESSEELSGGVQKFPSAGRFAESTSHEKSASLRRRLLQGGGLRGGGRIKETARQGWLKIENKEELERAALKTASGKTASSPALARLVSAVSGDPPWYSIVPMTLDRNVLLAAGLAEPGQLNENSLTTARQHRALLRKYYRRDVLHMWDDDFLVVVVGGFSAEEGHLLTLEAINQLASELSDSDDDDDIPDPDREFSLFDREGIWGGIGGLQGVPGFTPLTEGTDSIPSDGEEAKVGIGSSNNEIVGRSIGMEVQDDRRRVQTGTAERTTGVESGFGRVLESGGGDMAVGVGEQDERRALDASTRAAEMALEKMVGPRGEATGGALKGPFEDLTLAEQMDDRRRRLLSFDEETGERIQQQQPPSRARSVPVVSDDLLRGTPAPPQRAEVALEAAGRELLRPISKRVKKRLSATRRLHQEGASPEQSLRVLFLTTDSLPLAPESRSHLEELQGYLKQHPRLRSVVSIGHFNNFQASGVYASADAFIMNRQVDGVAVNGKLLQAMAYGLPILSTRVLPAAGLLVDGESAVLHDVGGSGASKLVADLNVMMQDRESARQHGQHAAQFTEASYMESVMFDRLGHAMAALQRSR